MLFGFVSAIVVGFLLTAVRTWTGQPGLKGASLACLVALWLAGRLVLFLPAVIPLWLVALTDLAFLPLAALVLARPVVRVKQWRNIVFVPLLLAMTVANAAMHWAALTGNLDIQYLAGNAMVMFVTLLMTIMAGRVVPMFTATVRAPSGYRRLAGWKRWRCLPFCWLWSSVFGPRAFHLAW